MSLSATLTALLTLSSVSRSYITRIRHRSHTRLQNIREMTTGSALEWDADLGVWVGERAAACDYMELPSPLYVLGYGSLIWRPGNLLENYVSYKCTALGMMRLFAQRSCDHRGTPEFPGLVLNLVEDSVLEELGYRDSLAPQSTFKGLVYLVPPQDTASVIEDLDYRERGGYHRHIIQVQLDDDGSEVGGMVVNALVYTGARSNPNFYLPPAGFGSDTAPTTITTTQTTVPKRIPSTLAAFNLHRRNIMTDTIAAAVGPSGPNVDYLCNLDRFLNASGMHDPFLAELATSVRLRLGVWRGRLYRHDHSGDGSTCVNTDCKLLGWGSNEFLQLSNQPVESSALPHTTTHTDAGPLEALLAHRYTPTVLTHILPPAVHQIGTSVHNDPASLPPPQIHTPSSITTPDLPPSTDVDISPQHSYVDVEHSYVAAGGGTSAVVTNGVARIWGKLLPELVKHINASHRHMLTAATDVGTGVMGSVVSGSADARSKEAESAGVLGQYNQFILIEGVQGIAIGHDHMLLLVRRPMAPGITASATSAETAVGDSVCDSTQYEEMVVAVGSDSHGQCSGAVAALQMAGVTVIPQADLQLIPSNTTLNANNIGSADSAAVFTITSTKHTYSTPVAMDCAPRILKLAVGIRHSAALTSDGRLHTWGDNRHGQVLAGGSWAPLNAPLVDVACGVKYTVLIDALGVVYRLEGAPADKHSYSSHGNTSHGPVKGVPVKVEGLPANVRWQRVTSGWSHVVLRGLSADAERKLVFYAWGKQHLGQYPSASLADFHADNVLLSAPIDPLCDSLVDAGAAVLAEVSVENATGALVKEVLTGTSEVEPAPPAHHKPGSSHLSSEHKEHTPEPLAPLPDGHIIVEAWCGSEYTIVADEQGTLWGAGWNEHGNLGIGPPPFGEDTPAVRAAEEEYQHLRSIVHTWRRVEGVNTDLHTNHERKPSAVEQIREAEDALAQALRTKGSGQAGRTRTSTSTGTKKGRISRYLARAKEKASLQDSESDVNSERDQAPFVLSHVWEGALACGGGHTLCLS